MDFGAWDGRAWADIPRSEFDRWMTDFVGFDFDGGESLRQLLARAAAWQPPCALAVGHAGWISAWSWRGAEPTPATWPQSLPYGGSVTSAA